MHGAGAPAMSPTAQTIWVATSAGDFLAVDGARSMVPKRRDRGAAGEIRRPSSPTRRDQQRMGFAWRAKGGHRNKGFREGKQTRSKYDQWAIRIRVLEVAASSPQIRINRGKSVHAPRVEIVRLSGNVKAKVASARAVPI